MSDVPTPRTGKTRTLWPLPGGSGAYLTALKTILEIVASSTDTDAVADALALRFGLQSRKATRSYLRVVNSLGFIEVVGPSVYLTESGHAYRNVPDVGDVKNALMTRIEGCTQILCLLHRRPMRIGLLGSELEALGLKWATLSQIRYRLRWLEEVGAVERHGSSRPEYRLADVSTTSS